MKKQAIIDTEGIVAGIRGSRRYKHTTVYVNEVAVLIWDPQNGQMDQIHYQVQMPHEHRNAHPQVREQWTYCQRFSPKTWNTTEGYSYDKSLKIVKKALKGCDVWAKGNHLEMRYLNDLGMFGKTFCYQDRRSADISTYVNELNGIVQQKYDDVLYKYYDGLRNRGIRFKSGSMGSIVLWNIPRGLPVLHDPMRECEYFLGELLKYKKCRVL